MTQNLYRLWIVLLIVSGGIALWFIGTALVGIWKYTLLTAQAPTQIMNWNVREISSSRFAIEAEYQFKVNALSYRGKTLFESPHFLNQFAAENYLKTLPTKDWKTWYRAKDPMSSSLERIFPQKKCLQALLTLGVFLYFYFARGMLSRNL